MFTGIKIIPLGFAQLSVGSTSVSTLSAIPTQAEGCLIRAETGNVRWCDGGTTGTTTPTITSGMLMVATTTGTVGDYPLDYMGALSQLGFIAVGGATATVDILYYRAYD